MEVAILVASCNTLHSIVSHQFNFKFCRCRYILRDNLIEVLFHEFKDKVETVFLSDDLFQFDDVVMV